jgi:hypothetical protein
MQEQVIVSMAEIAESRRKACWPGRVNGTDVRDAMLAQDARRLCGSPDSMALSGVAGPGEPTAAAGGSGEVRLPSYDPHAH